MKNLTRLFSCLMVLSSLMITTSCQKKRAKNIWDNTKTSANYKFKKAVWGEEIIEDDNNPFSGPTEEEFIALKDEDLKSQFADPVFPQSNKTPGDKGSGIPGIEGFKKPVGELANIFQNVFFNTDEYKFRDPVSFKTLEKIAAYLKKHKNVYLFVEGHADERGPEAYNLSLGSRRANFVRSFLVQKGVDLNQIHTISYGKEKPVDFNHTPDAWKKNRRAEFKIYERHEN
ncbi:MAG: OmpA family protein [Rhabdochlamydiaceae bacterium]